MKSAFSNVSQGPLLQLSTELPAFPPWPPRQETELQGQWGRAPQMKWGASSLFLSVAQ